MSHDSVAALNEAIRDGIRRCKVELDYTPTYFIRMVSDHGALDAVRQLITSPHPSDGFTFLWERQRLDLTVEYITLWPEFSDLFSTSELDAARKRLEEYGYDVDGKLARRTP